MVDFPTILPILAARRPELNLSIENPTARPALAPIEIFDPVWQAAHPDLTVAEFAGFVHLVRRYEERIARRSCGRDGCGCRSAP